MTTVTFLDRLRAARLMQEARLDALVLCAPHAFRYVTGADAGVAALFGRAGAAFALVPADPALALAAVVGDVSEAAFHAASPIDDVLIHPLWIETGALAAGSGLAAIDAAWSGRAPGFARPTTFDLALAAAALKDQLSRRGLQAARLGLDLAFVPARDRDALVAMLAPAQVLDGSDVLDRLMAIKHPEEVRRLRLGAELAIAGLHALRENARDGDDAAALSVAFEAGVAAEATARGEPAPSNWRYISIGSEPWLPGGEIAPGSLVKADVGCVVGGYSSDTSRNFVQGDPTPIARDLHQVVEAAHEAALGALLPGRPLSAVHAAATDVIRRAGLTRYTRGHFGHGLGAGVFSEAWPFLAADSDAIAEPGMVLAVEIPIYVSGVGGFNLEDQVLITSTGVDVMSPMDRGLVPLGR